MAAIAIVLGSAIGFFAGVVQFAFFDATIWQALLTYFSVSVALSVLVIVALVVRSRPTGFDVDECDPSPATLENWQDWQAEEAIDAERPRAKDMDDQEKPVLAHRSA